MAANFFCAMVITTKMLRCEYKDADSPAPHLNCCDSFNSSPEEFQSSCVNRLGGKLHSDGGCQAWDLPWLSETSPGRWRGSCGVIPTDPKNVFPDFVDDPSSKEGKQIYTAPDVISLEKDGKVIQASLYEGFGPEAAAVERDPRQTTSEHTLKTRHTLTQHSKSATSDKHNNDGKMQAIHLTL
jgi:hypothetical protein